MKASPKDFFIWLGMVISLYASTGALITLLFQYIHYAFPDPLEYYIDPYSGPIRFAMAMLIVLVPVAIGLMRLIRKEMEREPGKSELWVRRWALVLTIFLAGAVIVGDLITLINYFLGGDLTTRFMLKVATVLLVAGGLFLHFLADLKGYWIKEAARAQMVGYGAGALVVVAIVAGFFIMGTPGQVRLYRYDTQKVSNLQEIQWQIVNFYQQKQMIPQSLSELEDPLSGFIVPVDPQSEANYTYRKQADLTFELCAIFNAETQGPGSAYDRPKVIGGIDENWDHSAGEVCFERTIDPDKYPPYEKAMPVPVETIR